MTSIPFTELPIPKRTKEYVVIVKEINIAKTSACTSMVGNGYCQLTAIWQCVICNQWTCDLHEHKLKQFIPPSASDQTMAYSMCESCGRLTRDEQRRVYEFQQELNEL